MISELVSFALPAGLTRDEVIEGMREVRDPTGRRQPRPDPQRPSSTTRRPARPARSTCRPNREAAERAHDEAWRARIRAKYGNEPSIRYFETPLVVDNALGAIIDAADSEAR